MASGDLTTKPTIETVLERIAAFEQRFDQKFDAFRESVEQRLDEIEKLTVKTRGDMLDLRMEFRELRGQIKERLLEQPVR
ncbi:MAG TPA: hypothetical protein VJH03_02820 [Blastocatellia bacterium]|nr:hypothetical protein [Blastocatellia bacterium]